MGKACVLAINPYYHKSWHRMMFWLDLVHLSPDHDMSYINYWDLTETMLRPPEVKSSHKEHRSRSTGCNFQTGGDWFGSAELRTLRLAENTNRSPRQPHQYLMAMSPMIWPSWSTWLCGKGIESCTIYNVIIFCIIHSQLANIARYCCDVCIWVLCFHWMNIN